MALVHIIGRDAYEALKQGASLYTWKLTSPHNWWVGWQRDSGDYLWHSVQGDVYELYSYLKCFEVVKDTYRESERKLRSAPSAVQPEPVL